MMDLSNWNTEYIGHCAGRIIPGYGGEKKIPAIVAAVEFMERITAGRPEEIRLASLKSADDYKVISDFQETYYDGPDGPYMRTIADKVFAFGKTWNRHARWIDKGRDCREVWFTPESE